MILDLIPYSTSKNLGAAYNEAMALLPDGSHGCLRDGDSCWLTPDYGMHIAEYVRLYPDVVLTCWVSRIHELAEQQFPGMRDVTDIKAHMETAKKVQENLYRVTTLHGFVSGTCMIVPKSVWERCKFTEQQVYEDRGQNNILGVDNDFTNRVRAMGVPVMRMNGLYLFHTYRLLTNSKEHLL